MSDGNGRGGNGRFSMGNAGGPGRPKKSKSLDTAMLRDLAASAESGPELFLTAMVLKDREEWLERIESGFPKAVADKIKRLVLLAELAQNEIIRRLRDLPM